MAPPTTMLSPMQNGANGLVKGLGRHNRSARRGKRRSARRTQHELNNLLRESRAILEDEDEGDVTIRHLYYRLVSRGAIEKTEGEYKLLCQHLSKWRRSGDLDYGAFTDSTRWHLKPRVYDSMEEAIQRTVETYRRDLWSTQPWYVEIWAEKDAVASIVSDVTKKFGVPLLVCRGFPSLSSLYGAALTFSSAAEQGKNVMVLYLADYDPSGDAAAKFAERAINDEFGIRAVFVRIAVRRHQIVDFKLPTRPVKSSSHAKAWEGGDSVELDAIPPRVLREIVEREIVGLIKPAAWETLQRIEAEERRTLEQTFLISGVRQTGTTPRPRPHARG